MLVLSRKKSERLLIGPDITITVVYASSGKCRLGIEAPPDVPILREEIAENFNAKDFDDNGES